jgi:hypothetical protein
MILHQCYVGRSPPSLSRPSFETSAEPVLDWENRRRCKDRSTNRTYQPPRNETEYINPDDLRLCYGILAHDDVVKRRWFESLREEDMRLSFTRTARRVATKLYNTLVEYAARDHVHIGNDRRTSQLGWIYHGQCQGRYSNTLLQSMIQRDSI